MSRGRQADLVATLDTAEILSDILTHVLFDDPPEGSAGGEDRPLPFGPDVARLASVSLAAGLDHLRAWRSMLESDQLPQRAWATLARAAGEGAVTCLWLLDGDSAARRERAARLQLEDHQNRHRFETDFGVPEALFDAKGRPGRIREADHRAAMRAAGIEPGSIDRSAMFRDHALVSPDPPDEGRALYRLVGAYAHGMPWALTTMSILETRTSPGGQVLGRAAPSDHAIVGIAIWATDAATRALEALVAYHGR